MAKKDKNKKTPFNVFSKKGLMGLAMAGVLMASPFMLAGCSNGKDGKDGKDGAPGADAAAWHYGVDYEAYTGTINVGDFFIDTNDYILYQKTNGGWNVVMEDYGRPGTSANNIEVKVNDEVIQWRYTTGIDTEWKDLVEVSTLHGKDGSKIKLQVTADYIQYQYEGDEEWENLIPLTSLRGADGATWLSGPVQPTNEGKDGDFYLDTVTYNIYKKTSGTWNKIGNIKEGDKIPSYWKEYLDGKIEEINAKAELYGADADSFIFITDQHLDGATDYSAAIINYIAQNTSIKKVFFGGDTLSGSASDNTLLREYRELFDSNLLLMGMRGNHDIDGNATENSYYDIMVRPLIDKVEVFDDLYYCYDNQAQKIRYIVTDSIASKTNNLTTPEQISWLQEKILELESDWTTVIFRHGIWEGSQSATTLEKTADAKLVINAINEIYGEAKCTIAGIISGHNHRDYYEKTAEGYYLISTTTDCSRSALSSYDLANPTRIDGTSTEQTFDVVFVNKATNKIETIRIGAGGNRFFEYDTNEQKEVSSVKLNKTKATTWVGGSILLTANITPLNAANKAVTWEIIEGEELGEISVDGLNCTFTASAQGNVVIQVKTVDGEKIATCAITVVSEELKSVNLTPEYSEWTAGAIEWGNGNFNTVGQNYTRDWVSSPFIDVGNFDTITFLHVQTENTLTPLGCAFYDENKNFITNSGMTNGGGSYTSLKKTVVVPDGAKYFRCMWMNTTHPRYNKDSASYHYDNFYCFGNYGESEPENLYQVRSVELNKTTAVTWLERKVDLTAIILPTLATNKEVEWTIIDGEEYGEITADGLICTFTPHMEGTVTVQVKTKDGNQTATCVITIVETPEEVDITNQFTWTPGSIAYASGVASSQYETDWIYSNLIDVSAFDKIEFPHIQTSNQDTPLGYAFYDAQGNFLQGTSNAGANADIVEVSIDVPEGAVYFRVMWMNTTHSRYKAEPAKYNLNNFYCIGKVISEPDAE